MLPAYTVLLGQPHADGSMVDLDGECYV